MGKVCNAAIYALFLEPVREHAMDIMVTLNIVIINIVCGFYYDSRTETFVCN